MSDSYETLRVTRRGGVLEISIARPEVRNAFDDRVIAELTAALAEGAKDDTVRALLLSGEGKVFCAGADLNWMQRAASLSREENEADARRMAALFQALETFPAPTIAKIQGAALGGGTGIAACVDTAIAAEEAKFGFTEVRLGIVPAVISSFVLRRIGRGAARRYFATGEIFDGRRAEAIGLISEAVPAEDLDATVDRVLDALLAAGPAASRRARALVDEVLHKPYPDAVEDTVRLIAELRGQPEGREGMSAFLEKRAPNWKEARS